MLVGFFLVINLIISINNKCIQQKKKKILVAREALEPLIFCRGMEHDAKGMEDSC